MADQQPHACVAVGQALKIDGKTWKVAKLGKEVRLERQGGRQVMYRTLAHPRADAPGGRVVAAPAHSSLSDEAIVMELSELADEVTRLADRTAKLAIRLDSMVGLVADRWSPESLAAIDERDERELRAVR